MNLLPPFQRTELGWMTVLCAWCGEDLNVNNNIGQYDVRIFHFTRCGPYLASEEGKNWALSHDGNEAFKASRGI